MRVVTLDIGNSNPHAGIFQNEKLEAVIPLNQFQKTESDFVIASIVGKNEFKNIDLDINQLFKSNSFLDMPVNYANTLGSDRLATSYYSFKSLKPNESILVVDAGTFITIDLISNKGFEGGYIFPGINTFLKAYTNGNLLFHTQLSKLDFTLPKNTEDAILNATSLYLKNIFENIIKSTSPSRINLTGGSINIINDLLKIINLEHLVNLNPQLIHHSLFLIYQEHCRLK